MGLIGLERRCKSGFSSPRGTPVGTPVAEILTNGNAEKRPRLRCRATTRTGVQCRSTAVNRADGLCSRHGGRLDPAELGRRSAAARKSRKWKRKVPFEQQVEAKLDEPGMGKRVLSSGAVCFRVAAEVLEKRRAENARRADPVVIAGHRAPTMDGMVRVLRETEQIALLPRLRPWRASSS
jgi:hypothetical protein